MRASQLGTKSTHLLPPSPPSLSPCACSAASVAATVVAYVNYTACRGRTCIIRRLLATDSHLACALQPATTTRTFSSPPLPPRLQGTPGPCSSFHVCVALTLCFNCCIMSAVRVCVCGTVSPHATCVRSKIGTVLTPPPPPPRYHLSPTLVLAPFLSLSLSFSLPLSLPLSLSRSPSPFLSLSLSTSLSATSLFPRLSLDTSRIFPPKCRQL